MRSNIALRRCRLRGNWQAFWATKACGGDSCRFQPHATRRTTQSTFHGSMASQSRQSVDGSSCREPECGNRVLRNRDRPGGSEEFGSQGDLPEHPELLDWLAAEFMDSGWDVKHILALLFNSRAYCQTSASTAELNDRDLGQPMACPRSRQAFDLQANLLRDQALAVSGLLSLKMFGPPVRPPMPFLGLKTAFGKENDWEPSKGEDGHRRSIYTEIRRNNPYPSFNTFDAPNREVCTIRRGRSNTPLQAFVTLNDPVFVEAHQANSATNR
ncbi:MAG: DUF1553 domain-containing protein [Nocardioidaceae bacterium]